VFSAVFKEAEGCTNYCSYLSAAVCKRCKGNGDLLVESEGSTGYEPLSQMNRKYDSAYKLTEIPI
jgi:hypothetical protein